MIELQIPEEIPVVKLSLIRTDKYDDRAVIRQSDAAWELLFPHFKDYMHHREAVFAMYLDTGNSVLAIMRVSEGLINGSLIDKRIVMQAALLTNATGIIMAHNHPSGNKEPSRADIGITAELKKCAELFNMRLLDHLIITSDGYLSMNDEGYI